MRVAQVIGADVIERAGDVFNTSLIEILLTADYTGRYFWRRRGDGIG